MVGLAVYSLVLTVFVVWNFVRAGRNEKRVLAIDRYLKNRIAIENTAVKEYWDVKKK